MSSVTVCIVTGCFFSGEGVCDSAFFGEFVQLAKNNKTARNRLASTSVLISILPQNFEFGSRRCPNKIEEFAIVFL